MAMVDSSVFEEDAWGFYLQQATEKSLQAWLLVLASEQPPFTHNLRLTISAGSNQLCADLLDHVGSLVP